MAESSTLTFSRSSHKIVAELLCLFPRPVVWSGLRELLTS